MENFDVPYHERKKCVALICTNEFHTIQQIFTHTVNIYLSIHNEILLIDRIMNYLVVGFKYKSNKDDSFQRLFMMQKPRQLYI